MFDINEIHSYQITIKGRVQHVGFRYHTHEKACLLGIKGFVQNLANGNVYIEAEGHAFAITEFLAWCQKGPSWAKVTEIITIEQPVCNYAEFEIKK